MIHEYFEEYHRAVCASAKTWTLASLSLSHILGKPSYATNWETSREKNLVCAMISNNHGTLWWNYWQLENLLQPDITGWKSLCLCNSDTTMELIDRVNTTFEGQLENDDLAMDYWQCCRTLGEIQKNLNLGPLRQVNCSAEVVFQRYRSWNWFSELVKGVGGKSSRYAHWCFPLPTPIAMTQEEIHFQLKLSFFTELKFNSCRKTDELFAPHLMSLRNHPWCHISLVLPNQSS